MFWSKRNDMISIDPLNLLIHLLGERLKTKEDVADYVESIAEEAASLAKAWSLITEDLLKQASDLKEISINNPEIDKELVANWKIQMSLRPLMNVTYYHRLQEFYWNASPLSKNKSAVFIKNYISTLGHLLRIRTASKEIYKRAIENIDQSFFFDSETKATEFQDLSRLVEALHRESAALFVLAKSIRLIKE